MLDVLLDASDANSLMNNIIESLVKDADKIKKFQDALGLFIKRLKLSNDYRVDYLLSNDVLLFRADRSGMAKIDNLGFDLGLANILQDNGKKLKVEFLKGNHNSIVSDDVHVDRIVEHILDFTKE